MTTQLSKVILLKYLPAADLHAANVPADEPQPPHQVPPARSAVAGQAADQAHHYPCGGGG